MLEQLNYIRIGESKLFSKNKSLGVYSTRNFTSYSSEVLKKIILKYRDKYVFYFTYDFFLRSGVYKEKNIEYQKVIIIDKKFTHHQILKQVEGQIVVEEFTEHKKTNYLLNDLVILNFVSRILVLEATIFSKNLRILTEIASDHSIDVYCLPGKIYDKSSYGTNKMIFDGAMPLYDLELLNC